MGLLIRRSFLLVGFILASCGGSSDDGNTPTTDASGQVADSGSQSDGGTTGDASLAECDIAALSCTGSTATQNCNGDILDVDCSEHGGTCGDFNDLDSGAEFQWCSCGDLGEFEGRCLDDKNLLLCVQGLAGLGACDPGLKCVPKPEEISLVGCACDNLADGICIDECVKSDPDCA